MAKLKGSVDKLTAHPDGRRKTYWDDGPGSVRGLCVRVSEDGTKSFSAWTRVAGTGRQVRVTLGKYERDVFTLADARKKARDVLHDAAKGTDPAAKKKEDRERARRERLAGTFGDLVQAFLRDQTHHVRASTLGEWAILLRHRRLADLRATRTPEVTRGDLVRLFDRIRDASVKKGGKGYSANRTFEVVRRCFAWAVEKELIAATPCVGIKKPVTETERQRVYTPEELGAIVRALTEVPVPPAEGEEPVTLASQTQRDAVRLCLYTGVRVSMALGASWAEFDLEKAEWTIPADRTGNKSGVPWLVPLVPAAVDLLRARQNGSPWVFPARGKETPTERRQKDMKLIAARSRVSDFRPHDLRRCITAWMQEQRIPAEVRDAILGHRPPRLERTYNVHSYTKEKRKALERWAAHVERVAAVEPGAKVVAMPGVGA